jgi:hypothetical protein
MVLLSAWRTHYSLRYTPINLIQVVFSAGTISLASVAQRTSTAHLRHPLSQLVLCIQYLHEIGSSWQCANTIAEILKNLLHEHQRLQLSTPAMIPPKPGSPTSHVDVRPRESPQAHEAETVQGVGSDPSEVWTLLTLPEKETMRQRSIEGWEEVLCAPTTSEPPPDTSSAALISQSTPVSFSQPDLVSSRNLQRGAFTIPASPSAPTLRGDRLTTLASGVGFGNSSQLAIPPTPPRRPSAQPNNGYTDTDLLRGVCESSE